MIRHLNFPPPFPPAQRWTIDPWPEDRFVHISERLSVMAECRATMDRKRHRRWAMLATITALALVAEVSLWVYLGCDLVR